MYTLPYIYNKPNSNISSPFNTSQARLAQVSYNTFLNCNIMYIKWKYMLTCLDKYIYEWNQVIRRCAKPPPNYVLHINLLKELIFVKDFSKSIHGFNYNEICEMRDDVSTSFM